MAAAVIAGLLIGFAASTLAYRYRLLRVPGNFVERLDRELHLTDEQRGKILEILRDKRENIVDLKREFRRRRRELFLQAHDQIRAVLTPEQQQKFDREFVPPGIGHHHGESQPQQSQQSPSP